MIHGPLWSCPLLVTKWSAVVTKWPIALYQVVHGPSNDPRPVIKFSTATDQMIHDPVPVWGPVAGDRWYTEMFLKFSAGGFAKCIKPYDNDINDMPRVKQSGGREGKGCPLVLPSIAFGYIGQH